MVEIWRRDGHNRERDGRYIGRDIGETRNRREILSKIGLIFTFFFSTQLQPSGIEPIIFRKKNHTNYR